MTYTAIAFALTAPETKLAAAHGLICVEARYAALLRAGADAIEHRFASAGQWKELEYEVRFKLTTPAVARTSPIALLLVANTSTSVRPLRTLTVEVDRLDLAADALDQALRVIAASAGQ